MTTANNGDDVAALHCERTEQSALGVILYESEAAPERFKQLRRAMFYDERHKVVFNALESIISNGEKPEQELLLTRVIETSDQMPIVAASQLLEQMRKRALPFEFDNYVGKLNRLAKRRLAYEAAGKFQADLLDPRIATDDACAHASEAFGGIAKAINDKSDKLDKTLLECRFNPDAEPPPAEVRYSIQTIPICTAGNLSAITAAVKAGKSALIGAMKAAVMAGRATDRDTFSLVAENPHGLPLLHFDTEQPPPDHWQQVRRATHRAGLAREPEWLLSYCLTGRTHVECRQLFYRGLEQARERFGGIHSVLIDGVGDLVSDVNDQKECNPFVAELHALAIRYNTCIIGVIHLNPGSDNKTRGHLGSQLERKSETNLKLEKSGEITTVWSEKQRRAPILKDFGPRFRWSNEHGMHVSCQCEADQRLAEQREQFADEVERVFADRPAMRWSDLRDQIKNRIGVKKDAAEKRIKDYLKLNTVRKTVANLYERAA
ncbi:MAG: AAA family ATPase [Verrucomicrobia subdivision 3 bacterium]|nr:AAA family ATPase [Limisphaerales bacterium]